MTVANQEVGRPVVLAIGGSDSAGMAGVQADLRAIGAIGAHGVTAITAVTAQNSNRVLSVNPVPDEALRQQLAACAELAPAAIKIGLLATAKQVEICAEFIRQLRTQGPVAVVLDPVLVSSSGTELATGGVDDAIVKGLLPLCTLITPNRDEAARLSGAALDRPEQAATATQLLRERGAHAVLLKGGHWQGETCNDCFSDPDQHFWLASPRSESPNRRGTGCTLASAIAAALALRYSLADAVVIGKMAVNQGLRQSYGWPAHEGPLQPTHFPDDGADLPILSETPISQSDNAAFPDCFPDCGSEPLGLYPVVDRARWLEILLPAGVTTIQLRVKDLGDEALRSEISDAIEIARRYKARLFINDHWQLAIELGAYGVHLGQEDLADADVAIIREAGLRLGLSTHCHYEVARAVRYRPSYLACGPVYATTTKDMPWIPHGPEGFAYWRRVLKEYPLVAIGGIHGGRLAAVKAAGPDGIAMITALTHADNPRATAMEFIETIAGKQNSASTLQSGSAQRQPMASSTS